MSDSRTLADYSKNSQQYISSYQNHSPDRLYDLAKVYFAKNGATFDIGAGTGRDCLKLIELGYPCSAIEPVDEFVNQCQKEAKIKNVIQDHLPQLSKLQLNSADNIFCSTVLMHLPDNELLSSLERLIEVLNTNGVLLLSWRNSQNQTDREGERLFSHFSGRQVCDILTSYGCEILFYSYEYSDPSRPKLPFYIVIVKKKQNALIGLAKIQSIISRDRKSSTYKLALLRALCEIAQQESFSVRYHERHALVPLEKIAKLWVFYYWRFAKLNTRQGTNTNLKIYNHLCPFVESKKEPPSDFYYATEYSKLIKSISRTIVEQPVKYIQDENGAVFGTRQIKGETSNLGFLTVPEEIWRDLILFGHWIEQSLLLEWAKLTYELNDRKPSLGHYLDELLFKWNSDRDLANIRDVKKILIHENTLKVPNCVWSNKNLTLNNLAIDHIFPFSGSHIEHLWNLAPTEQKVNLNKSDRIPSVQLLRASFDKIRVCWNLYAEKYEDRFKRELSEGLNLDLEDINSPIACDALVERATHQVSVRGMEYWDFKPNSKPLP